MPIDRRKDVPKRQRSAEALRKSREKDVAEAKKARTALDGILSRHLSDDDRKTMRLVAAAGVDLGALYQVCLVDLTVLAESLAAGYIDAGKYVNARLKLIELMRRLGVSIADLAPPPATDLRCHVPPLEGGDDWYLDPETGEPLGREALNPPEGET